MAERLLDVLEEARTRGLVGPGPVETHLRHAATIAELAGPPPAAFLDLGSGGGIPGLVLAQVWAHAHGVLLESRERRCTFLEDALVVLGLKPRLKVACGRAEDRARDPELRGSVDLVVARGFGPPAVTAECGVGFLRPGGRLVVSEPQGSPEGRWPEAGLGELGLMGPEIRRTEEVTVAVLTLVHPDERWPRRSGIPAKRRLW